MLRWMIQNSRRGQRGQDYVEFAFILPVLMLMIMGLVDFGRVFNTWLVITHGAREGARYAAVGHDDADIITRVDNVTAGTPIEITIAPDAASRATGQPITVTVATTVELLSKPLAGLFGIESYALGSQGVMRYEGDCIDCP